jgi:prophage regulatory protein
MDRNSPPGGDRLLRRQDVEAIVGLGRSGIYKKMALDQFPAPVKLGSWAVRWRESDIRRWMSELKQGRRAGSGRRR